MRIFLSLLFLLPSCLQLLFDSIVIRSASSRRTVSKELKMGAKTLCSSNSSIFYTSRYIFNFLIQWKIVNSEIVVALELNSTSKQLSPHCDSIKKSKFPRLIRNSTVFPVISFFLDLKSFIFSDCRNI